MPTVWKEFDAYKCWQFSQNPQFDAYIACWQCAAYVGRITFHKEGVPMLPNENRDFGPWLRYPMSRFNEVITTLRYEKPLYLSLETDTMMGSVGNARMEPVGEEESS